MMRNPPATVEQLQSAEISCKNKLNILDHFCIVTVIGQIKPWVIFKTTTICFIKCMESVLSSAWGQIELSDIEVCQEMIYDIAQGNVNHPSSARCHIHNSGNASCDAWKQHCDYSKNSLEC